MSAGEAPRLPARPGRGRLKRVRRRVSSRRTMAGSASTMRRQRRTRSSHNGVVVVWSPW
ncbi:hypothetical protein [Nocardioides daphniae]|uniref:hypothetical protein n=1 Tax=Nocardioides daphniae TaxID=402297 RepID=UPI0013154192|nr:hypothetical protein [Nocardioides daphniae]